MIVSDKIKKLLQIETNIDKTVISEGLKKHILKHNHENVIGYFEEIPSIIKYPDYIGQNPRENGISLEYIKILGTNLLVAVKLDIKNDYFYVASFYGITDSKLKKMINSGRIIKYQPWQIYNDDVLLYCKDLNFMK